MNVGFVGLGKLGFPVALAVESRGHRVAGWDPSDLPRLALATRHWPHEEEGVDELLQTSELDLMRMPQLAIWSDLLFVAVQTPHQPEFEGRRPMPDERADFDYTWLVQAVKEAAASARARNTPLTIVVISTVLPGTVEREIRPHLNHMVRLAYNPFFIAMGTVVRDFLNPEFVLVGMDTSPGGVVAAAELVDFYRTLHDRHVFLTDVPTAELTKVAYNTMISTKIAFANAMMEVCEKTGADCDDLVDALSLATDRIISPAYLRGGMGDGGGCHPRDNIAMSWLARQINLSHDVFEDAMRAREDQARWIAQEAYAEAFLRLQPIVLLGRAFKPNTRIETGSPALLVGHYLREMHQGYVHLDCMIDEEPRSLTQPAIYVVTCAHDEYVKARYPAGSLVIDPHGLVPDQEGVVVRRLGRRRRA